MSRSKRTVSAPAQHVDALTDFWVIIPALHELTPEEDALVEAGEAWPLHRVDHLPEHEALVDFLIERSVEAWTRSRG